MALARMITAAAALVLAVVLAACSEKNYGSMVCPSGPLDTLVIAPRLEFQQLEVYGDTTATAEHDPGMAGMESLYLGASGDTRSEILLNYDFAGVLGDSIPASELEPGRIRSVKLRLMVLRSWAYPGWSDPAVDELHLTVRRLESPFDPRAYTWAPGAVPPAREIVNSSTLAEGCLPRLDLYDDLVAGWILGGETVGLIVTHATGTSAALTAFASREFQSWRLWCGYPEPLTVWSLMGPSIIVTFVDPALPNLVIRPRNDTSTFSGLADPAPGTFHVQTGLRSYPVLTYDIPDLGANRCMYRVVWQASEAAPDSFWHDHRAALVDTTAADFSDDRIRDVDLARALRPWQTLRAWPVPDVLRIMPYVEDPVLTLFGSNDASAPVFFSRTLYHGPGAPDGNEPALLIILGEREE